MNAERLAKLRTMRKVLLRIMQQKANSGNIRAQMGQHLLARRNSLQESEYMTRLREAIVALGSASYPGPEVGNQFPIQKVNGPLEPATGSGTQTREPKTAGRKNLYRKKQW